MLSATGFVPNSTPEQVANIELAIQLVANHLSMASLNAITVSETVNMQHGMVFETQSLVAAVNTSGFQKYGWWGLIGSGACEYVSGWSDWADVPPSIKLAIKTLAATLEVEPPIGVKREKFDKHELEYVTGVADELPARVKTLLQAFVRPRL